MYLYNEFPGSEAGDRGALTLSRRAHSCLGFEWKTALPLALLFWRALPAAGLDDAVALYGGCASTEISRTIAADPSNYRDGRIDALVPGDRLLLAPGIYPSSLYLVDLAGEENRCIVIEGPAVTTGPGSARFTGRECCNTVEISGSQYLVVRNLEIDGLGIPGIDAVKATASPSHHVTLENLTIIGHGGSQQTVGISTKVAAWNWVVRKNRIDGAGTGMYFGNSDGEDEFVNSLVEYNFTSDTLGYNAQFKHQNNRDAQMPQSGTTVIRYNVFSKAANASGGGSARPNLLVGHWPLSGAGSSDSYQIYGNFFWQNPSGEPLFQGEGNLFLYDNMMWNDAGSAIWIQPHNDVPKEVHVFHNTIRATGDGIYLAGADSAFEQSLLGNAVFAQNPLVGGIQISNTVGSYSEAVSHLVAPSAQPGSLSEPLDPRPLPGQLIGAPIDPGAGALALDADRDFVRQPRSGSVRGAHEGTTRGWLPALELRPDEPLLDSGFETGDVSVFTG